MSDSANEYTTSQPRRTGRPRNADRLVIPWQEVDRLLVFGETVRDEETGHETVRYPSYRELGRRYGISGSLIGRYATQHRCLERREENSARERIRFEQKVVEKRAEARAISTAEAVEIVDDYIRRFREALDEGRVRADGASDFNTMMRLKAFLEGKADSRQEVHGTITLEDMQARHRALRAQLESLDPAVTGEVPPRERDRARGLLADDVDGSSDDVAAMAPKRASEKSRVRRLPVEQFDRDGAGIPVASRRRADDSVEPAPRRRVAPHDREDAVLDDELAQEREDVRRGDVRALRRHTREDGYDEEEFENARVPRRARAASPTHTTAPRPRRPDREPRTGFPDKVYPRQPGRGWEDEPEQPAAHGQRMPRRDWR
jgi:hypothetical protein